MKSEPASTVTTPDPKGGHAVNHTDAEVSALDDDLLVTLDLAPWGFVAYRRKVIAAVECEIRKLRRLIRAKRQDIAASTNAPAPLRRALLGALRLQERRVQYLAAEIRHNGFPFSLN
jgi:hypothetical protein